MAEKLTREERQRLIEHIDSLMPSPEEHAQELEDIILYSLKKHKEGADFETVYKMLCFSICTLGKWMVLMENMHERAPAFIKSLTSMFYSFHYSNGEMLHGLQHKRSGDSQDADVSGSSDPS